MKQAIAAIRQPKMKLFITGGTGFIGKHVVQELIQAGGHEIVVLSRKQVISNSSVRFVQGEITDEHVVKSSIKDTDAVIHLAGCKNDPEAFYATNVTGTENIVSACSNGRVKKLIYLSSVGVIGRSDDTIMHEQTPCRPQNEYERSKYQAELIVKKFSKSAFGKSIILRPTNVFGEHDPENRLLNLINKLQHNHFYYVGKDISKYYLNNLYVKEISSLISSLLIADPNNDLYIINTPVQLSRFVSTIKEILDNNTPIKHLPYWPTKLAAACFDIVPKSIMDPPPVNTHKLHELTNTKQYSSALLENDIHWKPAFTMHEALQNMVRHYRDNGLLN
jgi:nucleoside-diphosphate-sugar epimerase